MHMFPGEAREDRCDRHGVDAEVFDDSNDMAPLASFDFFHGFMDPLGGRRYIDHGYSEDDSAECDDPFVLLAHTLARERIFRIVAAKHYGDDPRKPTFGKKISDGNGKSQAGHRNFCLEASSHDRMLSTHIAGSSAWRATDQLTRETKILATYHAIESLFIGEGKLVVESPQGFGAPSATAEFFEGFQMSGRADFIVCLVGVDTTQNRPLINQRDESHADREKYWRYHCICGDANRSEWAQLFKMGLLAIVLGMIEDDAFSLDWYIADPVSAMQDISRDPSLARPVIIRFFSEAGEGTKTPLDMMDVFLEEMGRYISSRPVPQWCEPIYEKALRMAASLRGDGEEAGRVLDWKIKERIFRGKTDFLARRKDIAYHTLTGEVDLYERLLEAEAIERVIPEDAIRKYMMAPPETTRAYFRGMFIKHFARNINFFATEWDRIMFLFGSEGRWGQEVLWMPEPTMLTRKEWGPILERDAVDISAFSSLMSSTNPYLARRMRHGRTEAD